MSLKGKTIGLAVTGSFCTFDKIKQTVQTLIQEEAELYPIFSSHVQTTRSRFGSTDEYIRTISGLAGAVHPSEQLLWLELQALFSQPGNRAFFAVNPGKMEQNIHVCREREVRYF